MNDSREPETEPPGPWRCPRPDPAGRAPSLPVESLGPPRDRHRTRRSWPGASGLLAVAIAGAVGLVRLAHLSTTPKRESPVTIVRSEVVSLWVHPALFDLAQCPSEAAACGSPEGFRRYAEERSLEKAWYILTVEQKQSNGESAVFSTIRRPYEMTEPYYSEFPAILAMAAGKPPLGLLTDFSKAKVYIIPDRFLEADPRAVLDELRMLEHLPGHETTP